MNSHDENERNKLYKNLKPVLEKMIEQHQLHLEKYAKLPQGCQNVINQELDNAICEKDILRQALIHTGIRGIEETICMYVTKYCRPVKIKNIVDTFRHGLDDAEAFEKTKKEIASRQDEQVQLKQVISTLTEKLTGKEENDAFKEKIAKLEVTSKLSKDINQLISETEAALTGFLSRCEEEMEEDAAMEHIREFKKLANQTQNEFQVAVDRLLDEDIQQKGQQLLDEYIKKLAVLSEECGHGGLQIDLAGFVRGKLSLSTLNEDKILDNSVDSRIEKHTEERSRSVTKRRRGLDRLLHISSWFHPEYEVIEYYDVEISEEITFISREKLNNQLISPIQRDMITEKGRILDFAKEETGRIKNYFYAQFEDVDKLLAEKAEELGKALRSRKAADEALTEANSLLRELEEIKKELELILDI